jgi:hypothetical protein
VAGAPRRCHADPPRRVTPTRRPKQYEAAKRFVVAKRRTVAPCNVLVVHRPTVTAPVRSTADRYVTDALVA